MCGVKRGFLKPCLLEVNRIFIVGVSGPRLDIYCYFTTLKKKKEGGIGKSETIWMILVTGTVQYNISFDRQQCNLESLKK